MQSALSTVSAIPVSGQGRRIAVLADIKEGGADVVEYHRQVGRAAAASQFNALFCYGDDARYIAEEARANAALDVHYFPTKAELTDALRAYIREQDLLLFKGSHSMELEDVVDKLFGTWYHEEFERYDFKTREFKTKDLAFRLYTDHAVVTKKLTTVSDVEIPACVEELPVTGIERSVFSGSKYTESVTFPDTLTNIRYCAFYKTNKLKTVSTPPLSGSSTTAPSAPARTCAPSRSPRAVRIWAIAPSVTARRWRRSRSPPPSARSAASAS